MKNQQKNGGGTYPLVKVLWTGGYDSTFRVVQLSRLPVKIQPYYLSDKRKSENNELQAIDEISKMLREKPQTKAELLPLKIVDMSERIEVPAIHEAYARMRKTDYFGTQYDWLACFATEHIGIELSIEKAERDKALELIEKYGALREENSPVIGKYWVLDKDKSSQDLQTLFQNYHLPLVETTKLQMKEQFQKMGCGDIIDKTWFCFTPIDGKPCGTCNPCKQVIENGLTERMPKEALRRYKRQKAIWYRALRKVYHAIKKA